VCADQTVEPVEIDVGDLLQQACLCLRGQLLVERQQVLLAMAAQEVPDGLE